MSVVIEAIDLSKKYKICHQTHTPAYSTIVESLSRASREVLHYLLKPISKAKALPKRTYEDFWALKDASFQLYEGDRIGIIGENGAGKSTLLKILSRIIEPSCGSVSIKGRIASLLEVGTGFHPELSGRENIFLNGAILGMEKQEIHKRFDEIVAFSEIEKFLDTPVKYYSSGMYARLGFAIAAHLDPDILIVDEVLAVGDARFQEKCLKKLNTVSQNGKTILFVSHNSQALSALCNKGILLEKGRVIASGNIDQALSQYMKEAKNMAFSWEGAIGNAAMQITKVSLDHTLDFFYQNESTHLNIECEIFKPLEDAVFGIEIKNSRQQTVLHSFLNRRESIFTCEKSVGKYVFSLKIDFQMLWEGEYSLHVNYFVPNKQIICLDEISLRFPVYPPPTDLAYIDHSTLGGLHYGANWKLSRGTACPA